MTDKNKKAAQTENQIRTAEQIAVDVAMRLGIVAIGLFLIYRLLAPFFVLMLWSAILAIAMFPIFTWLRDRMHGRAILASALLTIFSLLVVFGPLAMIATSVVDSLGSLAQLVDATGSAPKALENLENQLSDVEILGQQIDFFRGATLSSFEAYLKAHSHSLLGTGEQILLLIARFAGGIAVFALAVVLAGSLYIPGPQLVDLLSRGANRIAGSRGDSFVKIIGASTRGVARGVVAIAFLQTLAVGTVLVIAGFPHAGLLCVAVFALSILQVGAAAVVIPAIIYAWFTWSVPQALVFSVALLPIGFVEHFLKPLMMRSELEVPMLLIFAGLLAGPVAFGLPGLFLGPVLITVLFEALTGKGQAKSS